MPKKYLVVFLFLLGVIFKPTLIFSQNVTDDRDLTVGLNAVVSAPPAPGPANSTYVIATTPMVDFKSKKISLDLKGTDILDALKVFSQEGGMNFVIGKNVSGRVTIFLKDVNLWDAFNVIILSSELAYDEANGIISIMTAKEYEIAYGKKFSDKRQAMAFPLKYAKAAASVTILNQFKSTLGFVAADEASNTVIVMDSPDKIATMQKMISSLDQPLETKVFSLDYAKPDDIKTKLQDQVSKGVGSIQIDARTNKIIVIDYPEKIRAMEKVVSAFDEKNKQVIIEAQIVEITPVNDQYQMGVDWDYWIQKNVRLASSLSMSSPNTIAYGLAAGNFTIDGPQQIKSVVDAMHSIGSTKILSSPRIMALSGQEAKIIVGTKEAYLTASISQPASGTAVTANQVNFVDVGVQLFVTPVINEKGFVTMKIRPVISSAEYMSLTSNDQQTQVPIVSTSEAETSVTVQDGVTVMIAGLKKDQKSKQDKRIPILGDIPFLGAFFRSTNNSTIKSDLVIFLTPHISWGPVSRDPELCFG